MEVQSRGRGQGQIRACYIQTLLELPILVLLLGPGTPLAPLNSRLGGKCAGNSLNAEYLLEGLAPFPAPPPSASLRLKEERTCIDLSGLSFLLWNNFLF